MMSSVTVMKLSQHGGGAESGTCLTWLKFTDISGCTDVGLRIYCTDGNHERQALIGKMFQHTPAR